ncbi:TIGR03087 family PEP-CTERM/XrtA system glycosyltransferase [Alteripontixanthobacter maritimus]|nr:TIGR03087 family PEP-CTERM/XrtA system glycosyltransferase [Alteripontixanthobacter maritimus]
MATADHDGEILFLAHRIPFPPDRGDKIRSHHLLKALAQIAPVHVGTFGETAADMAAKAELAEIAASHRLLERRKPLSLAGVEAIATGKPVSLTAFHAHAMRDWIEQVLTERNIGTIFVFSGQMGQYIPDDFTGRVVVDLCDVDSAKFEAYGAQITGPRSVIDRREGKLLAIEEERIANRADTTLLITDTEAQLFRSRLTDSETPDIRTIRNGIDAALFDPAKVVAHTGLMSGDPHIVFTGQMDYPPNVAAALRVMDRILPPIRARHPDATFHVVGRAPVEELTVRNGKDGICVWGEVPDVKPFLKAADIVIAPLEIARGIQNKVLEAMAMARPVLLSTEAATGIDATDGAHFAVGSDDLRLVELALRLLDNPALAHSMGEAARDYVLAQQSWPAILAPLADIVCGTRAQRQSALVA